MEGFILKLVLKRRDKDSKEDGTWYYKHHSFIGIDVEEFTREINMATLFIDKDDADLSRTSDGRSFSILNDKFDLDGFGIIHDILEDELYDVDLEYIKVSRDTVVI